jgi:hypothetical protein
MQLSESAMTFLALSVTAGSSAGYRWTKSAMANVSGIDEVFKGGSRTD